MQFQAPVGMTEVSELPLKCISGWDEQDDVVKPFGADLSRPLRL